MICTYFSLSGTTSFIHFDFGSSFFFVSTSTEYVISDLSEMKSNSDSDPSFNRVRSPARVCGNCDGATRVVAVDRDGDEVRYDGAVRWSGTMVQCGGAVGELGLGILRREGGKGNLGFKKEKTK